MSKMIAPDYGQQFLFPPALEEWVPADHPVRFLREFVDQLDLPSLHFVIPAATEGRPPYAPSLLLKIWLYGYLHRIRSTRKLEAACRDHISVVWLTGWLQPDHNSLWRFWRDNRVALRGVFKRSAQLAVEAGLVGLVLQAVDGTKIQAASSGHTGWSKEQLKELLAALDKELEQTETELGKEAEPDPAKGYRLPPDLKSKEALREKVRSGLKQMEQIQREHLHGEEPEARRMSCDGKNRFGYNAQAVVDEQHGVVVAAEVVNQENDRGMLVPMVEAAQQTCGTEAMTVADSSYGSGGDIAQAAQRQMKVLVRPQGQPAPSERYHAHNFRYDPKTHQVLCPEDKELTFKRFGQQKGQRVRLYRCQNKDCPVRSLCSKDPKGRVLEIWPHTAVVQEMQARLKQPEMAARLEKRRAIVERIFGHIKQHEGFRRWTVRGLEAVQTQWALVCCAMNLRVLYRNWRKNGRPKRLAVMFSMLPGHFWLPMQPTSPFSSRMLRFQLTCLMNKNF